jgi:hypothetical protein
LEAIIYVNGLYLIVLAIISLPIWYFAYITETSDIYSSALQACFAQGSLIYSLIQGKIEILLYDLYPFDSSYVYIFLQYFPYIVAFPCSFIFGRMLKARYGVNVILGTLACLGTFIVLREGYFYLNDRLLTSIMAESDCTDKPIDEVVTDYRPEMLAPQIEVLINNSLHNVTRDVSVKQMGLNYFMPVSVKQVGSKYVIVANFPAASLTHYEVDKFLLDLRNVYCSNLAPFKLARSIQAKLIWGGFDNEGHMVLSQVFSADQCGVTENAPSIAPSP